MTSAVGFFGGQQAHAQQAVISRDGIMTGLRRRFAAHIAAGDATRYTRPPNAPRIGAIFQYDLCFTIDGSISGEKTRDILSGGAQSVFAEFTNLPRSLENHVEFAGISNMYMTEGNAEGGDDASETAVHTPRVSMVVGGSVSIRNTTNATRRAGDVLAWTFPKPDARRNPRNLPTIVVATERFNQWREAILSGAFVAPYAGEHPTATTPPACYTGELGDRGTVLGAMRCLIMDATAAISAFATMYWATIEQADEPPPQADRVQTLSAYALQALMKAFSHDEALDVSRKLNPLHEVGLYLRMERNALSHLIAEATVTLDAMRTSDNFILRSIAGIMNVRTIVEDGVRLACRAFDEADAEHDHKPITPVMLLTPALMQVAGGIDRAYGKAVESGRFGKVLADAEPGQMMMVLLQPHPSQMLMV